MMLAELNLLVNPPSAKAAVAPFIAEEDVPSAKDLAAQVSRIYLNAYAL
jgi:hypothetical protein